MNKRIQRYVYIWIEKILLWKNPRASKYPNIIEKKTNEKSRWETEFDMGYLRSKTRRINVEEQ